MMSRRGLTVLAAVLLAAGALVSVGAGTAAAQSSRPDATTTKIGFINLSGQIPYSIFVLHSFEAAAKKYHVQLVACDSNLYAQKAINCAAQLKTQGVQGIANFQLDATRRPPRVCAAGPKVPVVAIDIHQPPCEKVFYGANNYQAGKLGGLGARHVREDRSGTARSTRSLFNAPTAKLVIVRENGEFAGVKAKCPNVKVTKVTTNATRPTRRSSRSRTRSRAAGASTTSARSVATNDDQSIGAIKAAQSAGRLGDIYVGGQGGDPTSWPYLCGKTPFKNWVADTGVLPASATATRSCRSCSR